MNHQLHMARLLRGFLITAAFVGISNAAFAAAEADLLVAYDNGYADGVGGDDNAEVLAANAVAGSNAINERSGTGARIRIAGYHKTWWQAGRSTLGGYVGWMSNYGDSELNDVTAAADARGADLVAFICAPTAGEGAAAVAQQPGRYAAYGPGNFWANIVAHETGGHNYGCDHRGGRENPKTIMLHNYCGGGSQPYFSNPNTWLNGVKLLGQGSCLGDAVNGGDNAYLISTTAQGVADRNGRVITAPNLSNVVRRWSFNQAAGNAPAGTTITDSVSGTALATVQGNGAAFTGNGLRLPGGASGSGAGYLQLPSGIISGLTNVTIEIWATPLSVQNWARLLDFNNGTANYIMLSSSIGTDLNAQRFESKVGGATVTLDGGLPTTAGVPHHYAITFANTGAASGRWTWFRDGDAVAFLDVAYALSSLQDVNNWLGRSAYSGDAFGNCEYAEVRISSVAMTRDQVLANYALGPNRAASTVTLTADDPLGSASFAAAGNWSDGLPPSAGKTYETYRFRLRTPADGTSRTFVGQALTLTGGGITWKGTSSSSLTINNLTLSGDCELIQAGSGTWTLAGSAIVKSAEAMLRAANGPMTVTANLSGTGNLLLLNNTVTLGGNNAAFTGRTTVGDGRFSSIQIDSETRLGANPAAFTADQLELNRGVLFTTVNLTIDDSNRGIRVGESAALFNVAPGTTLTLAVPLSSPASGSALVTTPIYPNPTSGLLIKENTGTLVLTHPNNSHVGEININGGGFTVQGAGRLNNGDQTLPIVNNGTLTFNTTANQNIGGAISGGGALIKSSTGTLTLTGANTLSGAVTINAGTLYANPGNAAANRAFSYVSGITINNGGTLRSGPNGLFGWDGTQEKSITVNAGGALTSDSGADVGVATLTLAGGTLASLGPSATWGSWRFDNAGDKLAVTQDSTASAVNVKFANGGAVDVAAGRTLNFTGTITDSSSGGVSSLVKSGGSGTLILAGANTYTGPTTLSAGITLVNGSIGSGAVTVTNSTLGGHGTIAGAVTINTGGVIAPGTSIGRLTVNNSVTLNADSTTWMEISKTAQTNDQLRVTGTLSYGGALIVTNLAGTLAANDSFQLFNAGSTSGAFASTNLPPLDPGLAWNFNAASGVFSVISAVATNSTNISYVSTGGNLTLSWPEDHTGWRLQTQTNPLAIGLGTNWYDVPGSTLTNNMVLPLGTSDGGVFYRLVYP